MASVSTKIQVEGASKFKEDFKSAGQAVKSASAELKYFSNELTRTGASEDTLKNKIHSLNNAFEAEQKAIDVLQSRLEKVNEVTGGEAVDEINKLTTELYKHKDAQAQIQNELNLTENELGDFISGADKATIEVDDLGDKAEEAGHQIGSSFATDVAKATVFFEKLADVAIEVGKAVWDIGKDAVEYNSQMESYSKTIEAFFRTSGQSAEEATQNTADLIANQKVLSAQIGIGSDKLIDANKMLIASGVNGQKSQQAISALAKAIVATGGGNEELSRMASNLMQIQAVGKASAQDMKQFSMAGVDVYGLMAETTGKTVEELKEMDITFDMVVEALDNATKEGGKFFEASQVGASTLQGQMNLLESTVKDNLGTAFEPVNEALRDKLIPSAMTLINDIDWDAIGRGIAFAVDMVTDFVNAVDDFRNWYDEVYGEKPQETLNAFTDSQEDLNQAFIRTAGNIQVFDTEMAGAVEAVKGHGNHMEMEFDGMGKTVTNSVQKTAGEVKNILIDQGWEMLNQGETNVYKLGQGMQNGSIKPKSEIKTLMDNIVSQTKRSGEAYASGQDFVSGFASGMHSNNGLVANAAARIASTVSRFLHFSRPDVGPLHDYETWMPHFVEGLADTMRASEWRLAQASEELAGTITNNTTNNISMNVYGTVGQDPNQIADVVMLKIQQATNKRQAVWA